MVKIFNSKVAIAISCILASNIVVQDFIDDDADYKNSSNLRNGWGWLGVSSANAAMWCDTDDQHCHIVVDPCDVYDCYESPFPPSEPELPVRDDDGGGGGGGGEPPTEPAPSNPNVIDKNKDRINDCWKGLYSNNATGANLSSDWGWRIIGNERDFHPGWDIGTAGQTGVKALFMGDAKVIAKGNDAYNGFWLSYELVTDSTFVKYIHLASMPTVNIGQTYLMGDDAGVIGKTGSTSAIHLHLVTYPSKQAYDSAVAQKVGKSNYEKDLIDFNSSIDPATKFKNNVCPFPNTVKSSNNTIPKSPVTDPKPCPTCAIP